MNFASALDKSYTYLSSEVALQSIARDPYWPKWNSPWWHMLLLHEMGLAKKIPAEAVNQMVAVLKTHYLPIFPLYEKDIPIGTDPIRKIACLCSIGNMYQVLFACGVNVDQELPWMKEWFFRYQLTDGGFNCDEAAYTKDNPKSSIVTTVAILEAVLFCRTSELTTDEILFLNRGAEYLIKQKLFRKISTAEVIDKNWLEIRFPRFYEYDFLRGYYFLEKWRQKSGFTIPDELAEEVEMLVSKQLTPEGIQLKRYNLFDKRSYNFISDGQWAWGEASEFDLMKSVSFEGFICEPLTKKWNEVRPKTALVTQDYAVVYKNPIKLKAGELVKIEKRETNPDWLGWVYCLDSHGVSGWVSEKYLKENTESALVLKDYDATELSVLKNDQVKSYFEEFGWCWCRHSNGKKGWIPKKKLKIDEK